MTTAVCYQCGHIKYGALIKCIKCGNIPNSVDELAVSMALNDHFFNHDTLNELTEAIKSGQKPPYGSAHIAQLIHLFSEQITKKIIDYPYRMRGWIILMCIILPALLSWDTLDLLINNKQLFVVEFIGRPIKVVIFYLTIIGLIIFITNLLFSLIFSHRCIVTGMYISIPKSPFSMQKSIIKFGNIRQLKILKKNSQRILNIYHTDGRIMVKEFFLPNAKAFDKLYSEINSRIPHIF